MSTIIEVNNLSVQFKMPKHIVYAVNDVSFRISKNEILGIIGESGSGKTVLCKTLLKLNNNCTTTGKVMYNNRNILDMNSTELNHIRGSKIAMVFQNPSMALNPVVSIGKQITEVIMLHSGLSEKLAYEKGIALLTKLGVHNPKERMFQYPHQQSGGINQRILIAIAVLCNPELLIADEPTSAVDVTMHAPILELFNEIKCETSVIFISHNIGLINEIADRVLIMYQGVAVEEGDVKSIFENPLHPYTKALLTSAFPSLFKEKIQLKDDPSLEITKKFTGCCFFQRCPVKIGDICRKANPSINYRSSAVRCHLYNSQ